MALFDKGRININSGIKHTTAFCQTNDVNGDCDVLPQENAKVVG